MVDRKSIIDIPKHKVCLGTSNSDKKLLHRGFSQVVNVIAAFLFFLPEG